MRKHSCESMFVFSSVTLSKSMTVMIKLFCMTVVCLTAWTLSVLLTLMFPFFPSISD